MVRLTRIYTKTGDGGRTRLGDMSEADKHDPRVEAYGTVDEANAAIGVAICALAEQSTLRADLIRVQNDLFDVGADLCVPDHGAVEWEPLRATEPQVTWLETRIDAYNARLEPLDSFVLPGGSEAAARLHLARTICRRAERRVTALALSGAAVNEIVIRYMNRLSDLLFVMARIANDDGRSDIKWTPGENR